MKCSYIAVILMGVLVSSQALAATPQQEKMRTCNAAPSAKTLKGDERKAFMTSCLKAAPAPAPTQQEKMKTCNVDASAQALKGEARNTFMSNCLKKK